MPINIAIDGPAGAGKTSVAKKLAQELGYSYVDTGALYRAIAYYLTSNNIAPNMTAQIIMMLPNIHIEFTTNDNNAQRVILNGEDITDNIRTPEISMTASTVSAIPEVRQYLLNIQKQIASEKDVVMEGRDIGTVILPNADVKFFLTASPNERAKRRQKQLEKQGKHVDYQKILDDINLRDFHDSHRDVAPLTRAPDAILYDTTGTPLNQVVKTMIKRINKIMKGKSKK